MKRMVASLALLVAGSAANGETLVFETNGEIVFVRCTDSFGSAACEIIADGSRAALTCLALDDGGEVLAAAPGFADTPVVFFRNIDFTRISDVTCRQSS